MCKDEGKDITKLSKLGNNKVQETLTPAHVATHDALLVLTLKEAQKSLENFAKKLRQEIENLKSRLDSLEERGVTPQEKKHAWIYIVIFGVVAIVTALLTIRGWATKPTVSVSYNVGDIISGLLVGISAVIAAITYKSKHSQNEKKPEPKIEKE